MCQSESIRIRGKADPSGSFGIFRDSDMEDKPEEAEEEEVEIEAEEEGGGKKEKEREKRGKEQKWRRLSN